LRVVKNKNLQILVSACVVLIICCSGNKLPSNAMGRLLVKLGFQNFYVTMSQGNVQVEKSQSPDIVYKLHPSSNIAEYKVHSFADDHGKMAYIDDGSTFRVYDLQTGTSKIVYDKTTNGICLTPVISPNGQYLVFVEFREAGTSVRGKYVITVVKLETGEFDKIDFENRLSGFYIISPGAIRWLNDSSGFTYTRTTTANGEILAETCLYEISTRNSRVLGEGIGGMPSPDNNKLLYLVSDDRKKLEAVDLKESKKHFFRTSHGIVDYTWSPDGKFVAILVQGVFQGKIVITDVRLKRLSTINTGQDLMNWDAYFVPMRWLPLEDN